MNDELSVKQTLSANSSTQFLLERMCYLLTLKFPLHWIWFETVLQVLDKEI